MKMLVAKTCFVGTLGFIAPLAFSQAPYDQMSGGFEVVYVTNADIPDPEKPEDVRHVAFRVTRQTKGGVTVSASKNLSDLGQDERIIVGNKDECLYNVDPIKWTKQGHFVRFERTSGPMNDDFFEPSYRFYKQDTAKLLSDHPPVNGKSVFESGGNTYELEIDPLTKLVCKATLRFSTGQVFEKTASEFKKFGDIFIATKVTSKENFNPVIETKTLTLESAGPIKAISMPFTKETLPPGSKVIDKIDYVQYEVDEKGKWQKIGTIPKPNTAQKIPPDQASKAVLFVLIVGAALSAFGTKAFLQARR